MKKVLNDENISTFSSLLDKSEKSMANIEEFSSYLVKNEKRLDELIKGINELTKKGGNSFDTMKNTANDFSKLSKELQTQINKGNYNLKEITQESFDNLNSVLKSLENSLLQMQDLINNINESPSDLILKQKNIKYGPGEKDDKTN